jgi:hypothetical protein
MLSIIDFFVKILSKCLRIRRPRMQDSYVGSGSALGKLSGIYQEGLVSAHTAPRLRVIAVGGKHYIR